MAAAYEYRQMKICLGQRKEGRSIFILLDGIEDLTIWELSRTANLAGAHSYEYSKKKAVGLTPDGGKNICRSAELYPGGQSDQLVKYDGRTEERDYGLSVLIWTGL